jgi:hypothetical protein
MLPYKALLARGKRWDSSMALRSEDGSVTDAFWSSSFCSCWLHESGWMQAPTEARLLSAALLHCFTRMKIFSYA